MLCRQMLFLAILAHPISVCMTNQTNGLKFFHITIKGEKHFKLVEKDETHQKYFSLIKEECERLIHDLLSVVYSKEDRIHKSRRKVFSVCMQIEIILCQDSSTRLRVQWKPLLRRGVWNYELVKLILHELSKMSDHLYHLARCYYYYFTTRSTYFSESSAIVLSTHLVNQCTKKCFFFWNDIQSC